MNGQTGRSRRSGEREPVDYARPHYVYRALDSYGHLLYVGCSLNVEKRLGSHRSGPWFRYAETIGVAGPWDRADALGREREAIESEAPYFNTSYAEMVQTKTNGRAAERAVRQRGWLYPRVGQDIDPRRDPEAWVAACEALRPEQEAWHRAVEVEGLRLKAGAFPFLTAADRLARYLAAREDAELARLEAAA